MFTDAEKTDIRRYLGYPLFGGQPTQAFAHRYYQHYGTLEFRMNNMQAAEETVVRNYLTQLATLDTAILSSSDNLDTDEAAVWKHNKQEIKDRVALFDYWRNRLAVFFGVPLNDTQKQNSIGLVV